MMKLTKLKFSPRVSVCPGLKPADGRLQACPTGRHLAVRVSNTIQQFGKVGHRQSCSATTTTTAAATTTTTTTNVTTTEDAATATWCTVGETEVDAIWRLFRPVVQTLVDVSKQEEQRRLRVACHLRLNLADKTGWTCRSIRTDLSGSEPICDIRRSRKSITGGVKGSQILHTVSF